MEGQIVQNPVVAVEIQRVATEEQIRVAFEAEHGVTRADADRTVVADDCRPQQNELTWRGLQEQPHLGNEQVSVVGAVHLATERNALRAEVERQLQIVVRLCQQDPALREERTAGDEDAVGPTRQLLRADRRDDVVRGDVDRVESRVAVSRDLRVDDGLDAALEGSDGPTHRRWGNLADPGRLRPAQALKARIDHALGRGQRRSGEQ